MCPIVSIGVAFNPLWLTLFTTLANQEGFRFTGNMLSLFWVT